MPRDKVIFARAILGTCAKVSKAVAYTIYRLCSCCSHTHLPDCRYHGVLDFTNPPQAAGRGFSHSCHPGSRVMDRVLNGRGRDPNSFYCWLPGQQIRPQAAAALHSAAILPGMVANNLRKVMRYFEVYRFK